MPGARVGVKTAHTAANDSVMSVASFLWYVISPPSIPPPPNYMAVVLKQARRWRRAYVSSIAKRGAAQVEAVQRWGTAPLKAKRRLEWAILRPSHSRVG